MVDNPNYGSTQSTTTQTAQGAGNQNAGQGGNQKNQTQGGQTNKGPQTNQSLLPGVKGQDYRFVRFGNKVYAVYETKLPNGKSIRMSWLVSPKDYKAYGIQAGSLPQISQGQHQALAFFGNVTELNPPGGAVPGEHPFQTYLKKLRELNGNVSWMADQQFMQLMLMGYAEGWSSTELQQRLTQTKWYQSRTAAERSWEIDTTKAERANTLNTWNQRITDGIQELLGPNTTLREAGYDSKGLQAAAEKIASGKWGDPSEGFELWISQERDKLEKVEGTNAWMDRQQTLEEQRAFMNRPEDMYEKIRQEAMGWLGPTAMPDNSVLKRWSERLVSEKASDADWEQYLQTQAKALYPWLGPGEMWQDRASGYKRIAEEQWGMPIGWDNPVLGNLGQVNEQGVPTGAAMPYDEFTKVARKSDNFWNGGLAKEEGFNLFNYLNSTFNGVGQ